MIQYVHDNLVVTYFFHLRQSLRGKANKMHRSGRSAGNAKDFEVSTKCLRPWVENWLFRRILEEFIIR